MDNNTSLREEYKKIENYTELFPLHQSVLDGNIEFVKKFESLNDINKKDHNGDSALHIALMLDKSEKRDDIIKILLEKGIDKNSPNKNGYLPISYAISHGNIDIVDLLIDDNNKKFKDIDGFTLLHFAASAGDFSLMDYLLKKNLDINSKNNEGETPLSWAFFSGISKNEKNIYLLLENGADVNIMYEVFDYKKK